MAADSVTSQVVGVRFQSLGKIYHFDSSSVPDLQAGDYVIVSTSRGREMGQVIGEIPNLKRPTESTLKPIERRATAQELVVRRLWQQREVAALIDCRAVASELKLQGIKIAKAEFSFDGSRLTFLYNVEGDEQVDLKELRRSIRRSFRNSRIEMRQVGPRDVAKIFGGMGACGLEEQCCSKFLAEFSPISIRMAKAQGISLNPQEITGICGRLRCCLLYEYEQYVEARKKLPKRNKMVITPQGEGKVVDVVPLKQTVLVLLDDGRKVEFPKADIQPYEELKALQQKASAPCKLHGNDDCDCKQKKG